MPQRSAHVSGTVVVDSTVRRFVAGQRGHVVCLPESGQGWKRNLGQKKQIAGRPG